MTLYLRILLVVFTLFTSFCMQALGADAPGKSLPNLTVDRFSVRVSDKPFFDISWAQALHLKRLSHYSLASEATRIRYELTVANYADRTSATKAFETLVLSTQWSAKPIALEGWIQAAIRPTDLAGQKDSLVADLAGWGNEAERKTLMKKLSDALTE